MSYERGNVTKVVYRDDHGMDCGFEIGVNNVAEILMYRSQGEGDKGYVTVWFEDESCIELYQFNRVYYDGKKAVK